jgi:tryptophanyl-tRNA synthetase
LGHYFGALENWIRLQDSGDFEATYFFSADWHALTTSYRDPSDVAQNRREMVADWIGAGVDPGKAVVFAQAAVPEHGELATLFGMITPIPWLERVPSYKEMRAELSDRDLSTIGFLGYPLLQTADVAMYLGTGVPVGEDQLAHIELSRQIVKRFNNYYGEVFPQPKGLVTQTPRVPGLDGRKMSKSYDNAIYLAEDSTSLSKKVLSAPTDPQRVRRDDPGNPEICNIFTYHKLVQPPEKIAEVDQGCRTAGIGCVDCKKMLLAQLEVFREPIRRRREEALQSGQVDDVLSDGNVKAQAQARETMEKVREAIGL